MSPVSLPKGTRTFAFSQTVEFLSKETTFRVECSKPQFARGNALVDFFCLLSVATFAILAPPARGRRLAVSTRCL